MEAVAAAGGTPYIAFKENTTGAVGGLFAKMFHFYCFNKDEFLTHYHKRSNVESTFSMVKAKFRDHVRSKTDAGMTNEVLCKILCHNICCLIQSIFELGIEAKFWETRRGLEEAASRRRSRKPCAIGIDEYAWRRWPGSSETRAIADAYRPRHRRSRLRRNRTHLDLGVSSSPDPCWQRT